ncbi:dynein heavy chain 6, axonemal [Cyclospora cayetanensis]|uniref:Dynein heavy chain 6, axonemal n=1 Tax=Cyclospora cayetanensis TaxID=88456 RepID=A0A6P6S4B7_9EIME|nr:dynein heavy chain 6, axonemal [Cyclospora cayetanensis]
MRTLRFRTCAEVLEKNLFSLDCMLRPALFAVRAFGLKLGGWHILAATGEATLSLQSKKLVGTPCESSFTAADSQEAKSGSVVDVCACTARGLEKRLGHDPLGVGARRHHWSPGGLEGVVSYTEKATTRMQCRKLIKFIRVAEYIFDAALIDFARIATKRIIEGLVRQDGLRGRAAATLGAALQPTPDKALLVVQLNLAKTGITISPSNTNALEVAGGACSRTLTGWQRDAEAVGAAQPQLPRGLFCLDISKLQKTLLPSLKRAMGMIQAYLPQLANNSMTRLLQEISATNAKLTTVPEDINAVGPNAHECWELRFYVEFNCLIAETRKTTFPAIEASSLRVSEILDLLKRSSLRIEAATKALFVELSQGLAALRTQIQFASYAVENSTKRFQEELQAAVPSTKAKVAELQQQIDDPKLYDAATETEEAQARLLAMKKQVEDVAADVDRCKRCEDILRVDTTSFEGFEEIVQITEALEKCIQLKCDWIEFDGAVGKELFWQADIRKIQETAQTLSSDATAEEALASLLLAVRRTWESLQLPLATQRVSKDKITILGSLDDVIATLEDSLVSVNTIAGSRFGSFIRSEIQDLQRELTIVQDTLEDWMALQTNWISLQALFASPDIRKQLPCEASKFAAVDTQWRAICTELQDYNICLAVCTKEGRLQALKDMNARLDEVKRGLEDYLQSKRELFPRFYFLSNGELLELVSQGRQLNAVETIVRKCFANLHSLWQEGDKKSPDLAAIARLSSGMVSAEGERVLFHKSFKLRGPVEKWLSEVETAMVRTLQKLIKHKNAEAYGHPKKDWIFQTPAQVAACLLQVFWTVDVEEALREEERLHSVHMQQLQELQQLTELVRSSLTPLERANVSALAIQTLHNRDVIETLIKERITTSEAFEWQKQLRHYWDSQNETTVVHQLSCIFEYGHEYLGAPQRLVITPLTDRCWLTITTALKELCVNSSIAGPAGSGKTESVKELSKVLALFCVVLNCSEAVDLYVLDKVFAGVMASGAWACLDEFNRLDIEVLSVVAQQLLNMRHTLMKAQGAGEPTHAVVQSKEQGDMRVAHATSAPPRGCFSCGVFVTLNPNYAGRAELPDNLQMLFRPVSMVIPDFATIAEITIFSEGFNDSKLLANKFVKFFRLCSEQLSPQVHYDFGLRAAKAALLRAGELRRSGACDSEEAALARAIRESNEPKFTAEDRPIFYALLADFFPTVPQEGSRDTVLTSAITEAMTNLDLTPREENVQMALHLHQLLKSRRGVILLGEAMSGKSSIISSLAAALASQKAQYTALSQPGNVIEGIDTETEPLESSRDTHASTDDSDGETEDGGPCPSESGERSAELQDTVHCRVLNPKALEISELLGEFNPMTKEWKDGVSSAILRDFAYSESPAAHQWILFDGPIDSLWVECLNTVLDDNQMLCLANGERIKLTPSIRLLFEVSDLSAASPATVSRCGMLFATQQALHWRDVMESWFTRLRDRVCKEFIETLRGLFNLSIPPCEAFLQADRLTRDAEGSYSRNSHCKPTSVSIVSSICRMLGALLELPVDPCTAAQRQNNNKNQSDAKSRHLSQRASSVNAAAAVCLYTSEQLLFLAAPCFFFCFVWTVGGGADPGTQKAFSRFCEDVFDGHILLPKGGDAIDFCFNFELSPSKRKAGHCRSLAAHTFEDDFIADKPPQSQENPSTLNSPEAMEKAQRLKNYFVLWEKTIPEFKLDPSQSFHTLLIPTKETVRALTLMEILTRGKVPILLTGPSGSGKTVLARESLRKRREGEECFVITQSFSSHMQPATVQALIESKLETKRKAMLGPPASQDCIVWIDDANLPLPDLYGSQPTAELLRQMEEFKGFYDRKRIYWKGLERVQFVISAASPSTGRQPLPSRVSRHFHSLFVAEPDEISCQKMFLALLDTHFAHVGVNPEIRVRAKSVVSASVELYRRVKETLLPTPSRPVYLFNFRHLKGLFQGLLTADANALTPRNAIARLWLHEASRIFGDRLMGPDERQWLEGEKTEIVARKLCYTEASNGGLPKAPTMWGDWFVPGQKAYREAPPRQQLLKLLEAANLEAVSRLQQKGRGPEAAAVAPQQIVFFSEIIEHLVALCRVLQLPQGHAVLLGVGATGKQSVARLAACIRDLELVGKPWERWELPNKALVESRAWFALRVGAPWLPNNSEVPKRRDLGTTIHGIEFESGGKWGIELQGHAVDPNTSGTPRRNPHQQIPGSSVSDPNSANTSISDGTSNSMAIERFREELRAVLLGTGLSGGKETLFLINDSRISEEAILADVDAIANIGEASLRINNLFEADAVDRIVSDLTASAVTSGIKTAGILNTEAVLSLFKENILNKLRICLCLSPIGGALRRRLRLYPGLTKTFAVQFFEVWGPAALTDVAVHLFSAAALQQPQLHAQQYEQQQQAKMRLSELCVAIHCSVEKEAEMLLQQHGDRNIDKRALQIPIHIASTAYVILFCAEHVMFQLLAERRDRLRAKLEVMSSGIGQLEAATAQVNKLQGELQQLEPVLQDKQVKAEALLKQVEADKALVDAERKKVMLEEEVVGEQRREASALQAEAQHEFEEAMPALEAALASLDSLDKRDITEIKSFFKPPPLVMITMEAVCTILGEKTDWEQCRKVLSDTGFLNRLMAFDKDHIPGATLKKLEKIVQRADFTPEVVGKQSVAAMSLCMWVLAINKYAKISKEVEPKRMKVEELNKKVDEMELELQQQIREKESLEQETRLCQTRLQRASFLTKGLAEEAVRWRDSLSTAAQHLESLEGDVLLTASSIIYLGPFTGFYRDRLLEYWQQVLRQKQLPHNPSFDIREIMSNPIELNEWHMQGLPGDASSTFSGIVVSAALSIGRVPLAVDPQQQAKRWLKAKGKEDGLKVVSLQTHKLHNILTSCVRLGQPLLVEDIEEDIPPMFAALLQLPIRRPVTSRDPTTVMLGGMEIQQDSHFRLMFSTKLENPHYLPEVAMQVCLVNFSVTREGLEAQLLAEVVLLENPDAEQQKTQIQIRNATDQRQLQELEETMLRLLSDSTGNILDDGQLTETLQQARSTVDGIKERLQQAESIMTRVEEARAAFKPVAFRGSYLFFVVQELKKLDCMYTSSLSIFVEAFTGAISAATPEQQRTHETNSNRIQTLVDSTTQAIFSLAITGIFERHKLPFAFAVAAEVLKREQYPEATEVPCVPLSSEPFYCPPKINCYDALYMLTLGISLHAPESRDGSADCCLPNPLPDVLTQRQWEELHRLTLRLASLEKLPNDLLTNGGAWRQWLTRTDVHKRTPPLWKETEALAKVFETMLILSVVREDAVAAFAQEVVKEVLGPAYVEFTPPSLEEVVSRCNSNRPLLVLLSPGTDPTSSFFALAEQQDPKPQFDCISLGRGQGPKASRVLVTALREGGWALLENCHLARSWMSELHKVIEGIGACLQQGSLQHVGAPSTAAVTDEVKLRGWRSLKLALLIFHAVAQERSSFGSIGWNIPYRFGSADLWASLTLLKCIFNSVGGSPELVMGPLRRLMCEVTYGGRVTDAWDEKCLKCMTEAILQENILYDQHALANRGFGVVPFGEDDATVAAFVHSRFDQSTEMFGLPASATIRLERAQGEELLQCLQGMQIKWPLQLLALPASPPLRCTCSVPAFDATALREAPGVFGAAIEQLVLQQADILLQRLSGCLSGGLAPPVPDVSSAIAAARDEEPALPEGSHMKQEDTLQDSLGVFFSQEVARFSQLLSLVCRTLEQLKLAIRGFVAFSPETDSIFEALRKNQVPSPWAAAAYPSLRPLASWADDLERRVSVVSRYSSEGTSIHWSSESGGAPPSYWLPGFYYPRGFMAAVVQRAARQQRVAVDMLHITFAFMASNDPSLLKPAPIAEASGVCVHGLLLEGGAWDYELGLLSEELVSQLIQPFPCWCHSVSIRKLLGGRKHCAIVPTAAFAVPGGCVTSVPLPTTEPPAKWTLRGTALLCEARE